LTHMGYIDQFDILAGISSVEYILSEMGAKIEIGAGVTAFQKKMAP
jgi:aspartate aminotransferase-like enzyme